MQALVLVSAGLFAVAGCSNATGRPTITLASNQELRLAIAAEPGTLDPGQQQWDYEAAIGRNSFETLLKPTKDLTAVTGLAADSYTVDRTGTVYTFKLHPGARWSDGQIVKAADFVYGWQRLLDPRLAAPYAPFYYSIKNGQKVNRMSPTDPGVDAALQTLGLRAVDNVTFEVTLEAPAGYFKWLATLWTGAPVRQDIVARAGKNSSGKEQWGAVSPSAASNLVGNGLFKISEIVPRNHITLAINANYAGSQPKPTLTKITEYVVDDAAVAYAKYKNGELDMAGVPNADSAAMKADPLLSRELIVNPELTVSWVNINVKQAPFDNLKVRQAFAQAIDRNTYVDNVLQGRALAATTLIPKGMRGYDPQLGAPQAFNAANANATLAASGMTASQLTAMNIKYIYENNNASSKQTADFVQAQLQTNLGVTILLEGTDSTTVSQRLRSGRYLIGGPSVWSARYPDEQDLYDVFITGSGIQSSGYSSPTYDAAVNSANASVDQAKRDSLYAQAGQLLASDTPVIFLYQSFGWTLVKPYVMNLAFTPLDDFLGDFYTYTIQIAPHS